MERTVRRILISLAIIAAAGLYTWFSLSYWTDYQSRLQRQHSELISLKNTALGDTTTAVRLSAVRRLDGTIQHRSQLCHANPLIVWQSWVIPAIKRGTKTCQDSVASLDAIASPLHDLRQYLDVASHLASIVGPLKTSAALDPSDWTNKGLMPALSVESSLHKLPATGDGKVLKDKAVSVTHRTVTGWKDLIAANKAKDLPKFITASSTLTHAYADYMGIADTADATLEKKVAVLTAAAAHL